MEASFIFSEENLFLIVIGIIWIIVAVLQDFKRREVDNIWNFSLIAIALAYRASVSVFNLDYWFLLNGLIGLGIFFILGHLFYYSRLFAGGDAKLMIAMGPILTLSYDWMLNVQIFVAFIVLFLFGGSIYALVYSFILILNNKKEFSREFVRFFRRYKKMFLISFVFFILWAVFSFFIDLRLIFTGFVVMLFPVLFSFAKAIEESCLVKKVEPNKITIGDWLYKDIVINGKKIKASWDGVSKKQLELIKKSKRKILVRYGIPFTPSFLIGIIGLFILCLNYEWLF